MAVLEATSLDCFLGDAAIHDVLPKSQAVHFS